MQFIGGLIRANNSNDATQIVLLMNIDEIALIQRAVKSRAIEKKCSLKSSYFHF